MQKDCIKKAMSSETSNLAFGKQVTVSSYTQQYVGANAVDGNIVTYWEGAINSYPNLFTIDFGSLQSIYKVIVKLRYVCLRFTANSGATGGQIAECEVYGQGSSNGLPDLVVTGITTSPASPLSGDLVTFSATVKNQGTASTPAGIIIGVSFWVDGTQVSWSDRDTASLAPGAFVTLIANSGPSGSANWAATTGTHTIMAWVDDVNRIAESNENNNQYSQSLTVAILPMPDLIVKNITYSSASPSSGDAVIFTAEVYNQGNAAGAAGIVSFNIDGTQVAASAASTTSIAAGSSLTITANGTWTAIGGSHMISAIADSTNLTSETDETNNSFSKTMTVPSGNRGATMPYTRYEAENASYGGGAILRSNPTFDYSQIAAQASNQQYVDLPTSGSYVEWTVTQGGAGVTMRFTMPDTSDGMGQSGSLDCYVNGSKVAAINLSSYWMWQYFAIGSDQPSDTPIGGRACFAFDEVHWVLSTALKAGDKIRIQSSGANGLDYGVDFLEIEPVPPEIPQPINSLSVTDYGASTSNADNLSAFNTCINAAAAAGKSVYIPKGTWNLGSMWVINANNITITGAGIWYTNIQFTSPNVASGGISFKITGSVDFSNMYLNSRLRTRYNQNAIYKCFMDEFGTNSRIYDFWEEHFQCGFWVGDYHHTPAIAATGLLIENGRIRNNLADGCNFCQGTSNSTVNNCNVRNNGDDGLAMWPDSTMGAPMETNNTFSNNTVEFNWRAASIAIFGGSGHTVKNCYIKDSFMGSGIRLNTTFPGYHFDNNTGITFSDITIIGCGTSHDCYNGECGAIDLQASTTAIKNITFNNININNTQRDAIQMGYGGGFTGINYKNITIDTTGLDGCTTSRFTAPHKGEAIMTYTGNGSAIFTNLVTRKIAASELYLIQSGFNIAFQ